MGTTHERQATPHAGPETDRVAAGMLGLSVKEFQGMTYLAKSTYRDLAHNLLQVATVTPK